MCCLLLADQYNAASKLCCASNLDSSCNIGCHCGLLEERKLAHALQLKILGWFCHGELHGLSFRMVPSDFSFPLSLALPPSLLA